MHLIILLHGLQRRLQQANFSLETQCDSATSIEGEPAIRCLVKAVSQLWRILSKDNCITLVMNERMDSAADFLMDQWSNLIPKSAFRSWTFPGPFTCEERLSPGQKFVSNALKDRLVESLQPDAVLHLPWSRRDSDQDIPIESLHGCVPQFALVPNDEEIQVLTQSDVGADSWNGVFSASESESSVLQAIGQSVQSFHPSHPCRPSPLEQDDATQAFLEELHRHLPGMNAPLACAVDQTFDAQPTEDGKRQLFVDVTELCQMDAGTGIQRVTRNILSELLKCPPRGFAVRPVFSEMGWGFRYAHQFAWEKFHFDDTEGGDVGIRVRCGDVFLGLDFTVLTAHSQLNFLKAMQRRGVQVWFVVYDLIPIQFPQWVRAGNDEFFTQWLQTIAQFDGLMCISRAVADDVSAWLDAHPSNHGRRPVLRWFHLGSDLDTAVEDVPLDPEEVALVETMKGRPTFLMVSTVEPRKGYDQALGAFEDLWAKGIDVSLVIVGREGWLVEKLAQKLRRHPENGHRLHWLQGISDRFLNELYQASCAVLMATHAEGFGLAVVEGARHKKPLILRDLPVFREIAGNSAHYFSGNQSNDLSDAINQWLSLREQGQAPTSDGVEILTWEESAKQLIRHFSK